jgi:hypothetical protein
MFLSGVLFVVFLAGCWLYCLTDAILTPEAEFHRLSKPAWIALIAATLTVGAGAWLITRPARRAWSRARGTRQAMTAAAALARHPASRSKAQRDRAAPVGPDDDPEFLRMLDRIISGNPEPGE